MIILQCTNCELWDNYHYGSYAHKNCEYCGAKVIGGKNESKRKSI